MGTLTFQAAAGGTFNLNGPNIAGTVNLTLPSADGSSGQPLQTNGSGTLSFANLAIANGGTGVTSFTANQIHYGSFSQSAGLTFDGTNFATTGTATAAKLIPTGSSASGNGMYLPATNSVGISTNGTNAVYIDSNQNVGIGTSTPRSVANFTTLGINGTTTAVVDLFAGNTRYGTFSATSAGVNLTSVTASPLIFNTSNTEQARIDSSGNVGIGTSSVTSRLNVISASALYNGGIRVNGNASGNASSGMYIVGGQATTHYNWLIGSQFNVGNAFEITPSTAVNGTTFSTPSLVIDSSGNVGIGTTSPSSYGKLATIGNGYFSGSVGIGAVPTYPLHVTGSGTVGYITQGTASGYTLILNALNQSGTYYLVAWQAGGTTVASVTTNGTTVTYGTGSDYRLKNNIQPMTDALSKVARLNPVTWKWNLNGTDGQGFIAHELAEVCPDAVVGEKDAVDEDGNPRHQMVDTSFLVATLTAAIQEQQALITTLTARIEALESKG